MVTDTLGRAPCCCENPPVMEQAVRDLLISANGFKAFSDLSFYYDHVIFDRILHRFFEAFVEHFINLDVVSIVTLGKPTGRFWYTKTITAWRSISMNTFSTTF